MSAGHTPGPWKATPYYYQEGDGADKRLIDTGYLDTIAEVRMGHDDILGDIDANARLIAAAPMLLEACDDALKALRLIKRGLPVLPETIGSAIAMIDATIEELETAVDEALGQ